jgi:nucleoid-associated protein YgaU
VGLIDFMKEAGEKAYKEAEEKKERAMASALERRVTDLGLEVQDLGIAFDDGVATVKGTAPSQTTREMVVLVLGNTQGVARVDDRMSIDTPEPEATMYTVQPGDTLSKIAKAQYGNAMKYMTIFQANTPMLKDPNRIYPGQVLRIPPLGD